MPILRKELYERGLGNYPFRSLDSFKLTKHGGDMQWQCHMCMLNADFLMNFFDIYENHREERKQTQCLAIAHYLTYIPYGEGGYEVAEAFLRAEGRYPDLAAFRFAKLSRILRECQLTLTEEEEAYVRGFFEGYRKDCYDLHDQRDVTALYCRAHAALEAHHGEHAYILRTHNEKFFTHIKSFYYDEKASLTKEELLSEIAPFLSFGEEEILFLRSYLSE